MKFSVNSMHVYGFVGLIHGVAIVNAATGLGCHYAACLVIAMVPPLSYGE